MRDIISLHLFLSKGYMGLIHADLLQHLHSIRTRARTGKPLPAVGECMLDITFAIIKSHLTAIQTFNLKGSIHTSPQS